MSTNFPDGWITLPGIVNIAYPISVAIMLEVESLLHYYILSIKITLDSGVSVTAPTVYHK